MCGREVSAAESCAERGLRGWFVPDLRHTRAVDWRVKTFESEARAAFDYLVEDGFTVDVEPSGDPARRPTRVELRFLSSAACVETRLVLGLAGEDEVVTDLVTTSGSNEIGTAPAHKGHEMRKALHSHAEEVRRLLHPEARVSGTR